MNLNPKNRSVSFQKRLKMFYFQDSIFYFHHFTVFTRCRFQNVPIRVPFSKSAVFKICRQKMCRFRVNRRPIRRIFHRFQNVPASCERSRRDFSSYHWKSISLTLIQNFKQKKITSTFCQCQLRPSNKFCFLEKLIRSFFAHFSNCFE